MTSTTTTLTLWMLHECSKMLIAVFHAGFSRLDAESLGSDISIG
jgi:hypothetical protein